ncbi:MAG: tyrosine-type recombinase/integrase [Syntrophales bacterium]
MHKFVLVSPGSRINSVKSSVASALRKAGIEDFHSHDLRNRFASHMIMRGPSLRKCRRFSDTKR